MSTANVAVYPPGATLALRHTRDYEFVWIMEGASIAYFDEAPIPAPPDTILLRRPGMTDRYDWAPETRTVHAFCHFSCRLPRRGWPPPATWPVAHLARGDDILRPLFRFLLNAHLLAEPLRATVLQPALDLMLKAFITGRFALAAEPQVDLPPPIEKAMAHIRRVTFYETPRRVTLAELARAAHVSPEHLCRLFRRRLSLGPLECARLARLQFASTLLARSALTIKEVADAAGFATPYHFSRVFRQTYGIPPRHYRRAVSEGIPVPPNPIVRMLRLEERREVKEA
ncbi:MAG: helix-turn-helix transcriptional regulator [Lentisphaerae bacterium]|nr:helix-turn-helix transcriptional regulator [Lentisphaerota bacterium]